MAHLSHFYLQKYLINYILVIVGENMKKNKEEEQIEVLDFDADSKDEKELSNQIEEKAFSKIGIAFSYCPK